MASLEKLNLKKKTKKSFRLNLDLCLMLFYAARSCVRKTNIKSNILWFGTDRRKTNLRSSSFFAKIGEVRKKFDWDNLILVSRRRQTRFILALRNSSGFHLSAKLDICFDHHTQCARHWLIPFHWADCTHLNINSSIIACTVRFRLESCILVWNQDLFKNSLIN